MYINEYTDINKALELLKGYGSLGTDTPSCSPSLNERTAYETLLANKTNFDVAKQVMFHKPSKRLLLKPEVGMGVTLHYPQDSFPYEVIKVISEQTLEIRRMTATAIPGWKADFTPGGFVGHVHNQRDQNFTYASDPTGSVTRIRLNKRGRWMDHSIPFTVGYATYFVDMNA
jgi:hypothetical protein